MINPADDESAEREVATHLEPLGMIYGGSGTPLQETWLDLTAPSQVLYGLNGAGKTRVLNALAGALTGTLSGTLTGAPTGAAAGGRILARIPFEDDRMSNALSWQIGEMLAGDRQAIVDDATGLHEAFEATLKAEFERRSLLLALGETGVWGEHASLSWGRFLEAGASTPWWLFTPTGSSEAGWTVNPVVMVDGQSGDWAQHLAALHDLYGDDYGPLPSSVGLVPLWWDAVPEGAPSGIAITLLERTTGVSDDSGAGWPFGVVVTDQDCDLATRTRQHLFSERPYLGGFDGSGSFARAAIRRSDHLVDQGRAIEKRANEILTVLLADAPVLGLTIGDEQDWFLGDSCKWSATRLLTDEPLALDALSFAERRWAHTAISLALASLRTLGPDPVEEIVRLGIDGGPTDPASPPRAGATWLLLDEPERGLHRTAEAQMGRGIQALAARGLRTVLATHSPELLDREIGDIRYVRRRSVNGDGCILPMARFDSIRDSLGLNPSDLLRRTRGYALVEGEHDREVLRGMVGEELDALGVKILAVRGSTKLKTVVDSQFLYDFTDAMLFPILDDVALGTLDELWQRHLDLARVGSMSDVVASLVKELRDTFGDSGKHLGEFLGPSLKNGTFERVLPLGIPQSDVLECLPVTDFIPSAKSWEQVRAAGTANNQGVPQTQTQFKDYLRGRGANLSEDRIRQVARQSPHPDIKALAAAISERLAH